MIRSRLIPLGSLVAGLLLAAGLLLVAVSGRNQIPPAANTDKVTIGATIFPLADIVRQIGGDHVEVVQIIAPGVSEHSAALSPEQLQQLQKAPFLFQIGHGLDNALSDKIIGAIPSINRMTVDEGITLREFAGGTDPHYWLTAPNGQVIAANIARQLSDIDPRHANTYQENLKRVAAQLTALEEELQAISSTAPQKQFIAMHDAWGYLANHYGFNLAATYEPVEGRDPSLADLNRLQSIISQHNIRVFYSEPQKESIGAVRLLRDDFGLSIRVLDPVGGLPPYDSFANLLRANLQALAAL